MLIHRFGVRTVLAAAWLGMLGVGADPDSFAMARAQENPLARGPASDDAREGPPAGGEPVRAYDRPVPRPAALRRMVLAVVDDETGRPLADVEVRILNAFDLRAHVFRTDAGGRLRFEYPGREDVTGLSLQLRKDGHVPLGCGWNVEGAPRPPEALTLRLRRGTTMGGIVVDEAGRPIEGVTVVLTVTRLGQGKRGANPTGHESYREIPSRTGPDGRWRADGVPPDAEAVQLRLIHPDHVSDGPPTLESDVRTAQVAALRDGTDRQVMSEGVTLEGRVLDEEGRPIPGARLRDAGRHLDPRDFEWCRPPDEEGRFRVHLPPRKLLAVTAEADGYAAVTEAGLFEPGQKPIIEFRLPRGKRLRGRLVDPAGRPIEGATVQALPPSPAQPYQFRARTDAEGRFEWDEAPAGVVPFHIAAEGFLSDNLILPTAGPGEIAITLRPAVDICLDAVDAKTGESIRRFRVEMGLREPGKGGYRWLPPTGRTAPRKFRQTFEAADGPFHFKIGADGYETVRIIVPSRPVTVRRTIRLKRAPGQPGAAR